MRDYFWGTTEAEVEEEGISIHDFASESKGHASTDNNVVDFSHNRIYFYSGVTRPKILKLNKGIFNLNVGMLSKTGPLDYAPPPIVLHINSYGGSVFAGLSAVDYIKTSKIPVHTIIDGCAASAATLMSCVGAHRQMHRNACMLVHQLSGAMWGKFQEMQDDMQNSEMLMEKIKDIYREHTKIPKKEMDNILKHDIWWEAEKCLQYGLVDEII
jgi:ATP-dependent Clp endopeptidase proteolytic subunit ClpP